MTQDEQNLDLLSIFHYVVGGLTALMSCMFLMHLGIGIASLTGAMEGPNGPPAAFGWIFTIMGGTMLLAGWTLAILLFLAGRNLKRRTAYRFCFVVACIACILMPFGTVLGIFTILMLNKEAVKPLFVDRCVNDPA